MRERRDEQCQRAPDGEGNAVQPQRVRARRAEREDLLISRQPSQAQLHAEHERERDADDEKVRAERRREAEKVLDGNGAGEDHLVELQQLQDDEELEDGEQTDAQRDGDLPE